MTSSALKTCISCDYSLRGIESELCPECGAPTAWYRLTFFDQIEFRRAIETLTSADIPFHELDAGLGMAGVQGLIAGGGVQVHELRVGLHHRQAAADVLEHAGIGPQVPVLDRTERACPECDALLPPGDDPVCSSCHTAYCTIDADDPDAGVTTASEEPTSKRPMRRGPHRLLVILWLAVGVTFLSPLIWAFTGGSSSVRLGLSAAIWVLASLVYLVTSRRRRSSR